MLELLQQTGLPFHEVPSLLASLIALGVIVAVSLWLAGRAVEQREYVLEQ